MGFESVEALGADNAVVKVTNEETQVIYITQTDGMYELTQTLDLTGLTLLTS